MGKVLSLISQHLKANTGFAIYRWPNEKTVSYWAGKHDARTDDSFVFHPYDEDNCVPVFLRKDEFIQYDSLLSVMDQIQATTEGSITMNPNDDCTSTSKEDYQYGFQVIQDSIANGTIEKAILSRVKSLPFDSSNIDDVVQALFTKITNGMCYVFFHPQTGLWLGASPELIVKQDGEHYKTTSLAGTKSKETIDWGNKEINEHKIVTDSIINNLSALGCSYTIGDVSTKKAGALYHLECKIEFNSSPTDMLQVLKVLHPTPAIGGYPKKEAADVIKQAEKHSRSYYCGYLGEKSLTNSQFFVNLRCAKIRDKHIQLYVGGGITKDSLLELEWEECNKKAETIGSLVSA